MDRAAAVAMGRQVARTVGNYPSGATVMRKTGELEQNESTGLEDPIWAAVHVDIPFRLDGGSTGDGGSRTVTVAGIAYEQATAVGHMPWDTADLLDDDHIDITSGEHVGSVWRIVKAVMGDQQTARRLPVEGVQRPEEWA